MTEHLNIPVQGTDVQRLADALNAARLVGIQFELGPNPHIEWDSDASKFVPSAPFFQPGHTYADLDPAYDWRFRCDIVTTHPENGERTALGWRFFKGTWEPIAYGEDEYDLHGFVGTTVQGAPRG
ncbi:hypothetical protein [Streptomyces griseus]|uniref:hypothetical protein n=1 Tax=Streptomyces griseus TaxID=1911 RepID=UPI003701FCFF